MVSSKRLHVSTTVK